MFRPAPSSPRLDTILFALIVVVFVSITAATLLTFPPYYEDESWNYLPVFEALRGNGFTWAAFGEGRPMLGVFLALVTPLFAVVPSGPEPAVRIVAAAWAVLGLGGAYMLARRFAPRVAWIAPALMVATQVVFVAMRYGRPDGPALALTLWSLVAATYGRPLIAGLLFGLAASVHPVFVWAAFPCAWFLDVRDLRRLGWLSIGAATGAAPQLGWMIVNWHDVQEISRRYAVSSSVGSNAARGIFESIAHESARYTGYWMLLQPWQRVTEICGCVVLPAAGLRAASSRRLSAVLLAPPVLTLAVVAQNKNPYYLFVILPFLAVLAAYSVEHFPQVARRIAVVFVVATVGLSASVFTWRGIAHHAPTTADATANLARELPRGATVFAANVYAGLIQRRPDLQFFNYHSLSSRTGWTLPACADLPGTIHALIQRDPRSTSPHDSRTAYVIAPPEPAFTDYLRLIYVKSTKGSATCLLGGAHGIRRELRVCHDTQTPCDTLMIAPMSLFEGDRREPAH